MAFIEWTDDYATGIADIDAQHQQLVEIINKFETAQRKGKGNRIMGDILKDLIGYTQEHFAFEENLMAETGYQGLKLHQAQHRQLLQKVERFQFEFTQGVRITKKINEFLKHWLLDHVKSEDLGFAGSLESAAVQEGTQA